MGKVKKARKLALLFSRTDDWQKDCTAMKNNKIVVQLFHYDVNCFIMVTLHYRVINTCRGLKVSYG